MKRILIFFTVFGFIVSLIFSFLIFPSLYADFNTNIDPDRFSELALSLTRGNGFVYSAGGTPVMEKAPAYPLFIGFVFWLLDGYSLEGFRVVQSFVHALTTLLSVYIAWRLSGERSARIVGYVMALHPIALWYTTRFWIEPFHACIICVCLIASMKLLDRPTLARALIAGIAIGVAILTKSVWMLFPLLLSGLYLVRFHRAGIRYVVPLLLAVLLTLAPWLLRNYDVSNAIAPVHTSLGFNLVQGDIIGEHWPSSELFVIDYWRMGADRVDSILAGDGPGWETVQGDWSLVQMWFRQSSENLISLPGRFLANFCTLWFLSDSLMKSIILFLGFVPFGILAATGIAINGSAKSHALLILTLTYYVVVHAVIVGWGRYMMAGLPMLVILSAPSIAMGWDMIAEFSARFNRGIAESGRCGVPQNDVPEG